MSRPIDWYEGISRSAFVAALLLLAVRHAPEVIRWSSEQSIFLTGYGLLFGGYLGLAALYIGVGWAAKGFTRDRGRGDGAR